MQNTPQENNRSIERFSDIVKVLWSRIFKTNIPPVKSRANTNSNRPKDSWIRIIIVILFSFFFAIVMPIAGRKIFQYEVGFNWNESPVITTFDFPIYKPKQEYEAEVKKVTTTTPVVFTSLTEETIRNRKKLIQYFEILLSIEIKLKSDSPIDQNTVKDVLSGINPPLRIEELKSLNTPIYDIQTKTLELFDLIQNQIYIDKNPNEISSIMIALRKSHSYQDVIDKNSVLSPIEVSKIIERQVADYPQRVSRVINQILSVYCTPNFRFNQSENDEYLQFIKGTISPYSGLIKKGDTIIKTGQIITPEVELVIQSYNRESSNKSVSELSPRLIKSMGYFFTAGLIALLIVIFLKLNYPGYYYNQKSFFFIFTLLLLIVIMEILIREFLKNSLAVNSIDATYLLPFCLVPILFTIYFDDRLGFFINLILSILSLIINPNHFTFFFIHFISGSIAVFQVRNLRHTAVFNSAAGYVTLSNITCFIGIEMLNKSNFDNFDKTNLIILIINGLATILVNPLTHLIEKIPNLGLYSNVTYLNLVEQIHENSLLMELEEKAPGTYHHSREVAELAQELGIALNLNDIQLLAAGWFHDIGKIEEPQYFSENQAPGLNIHDELNNPEQSALKIIQHVQIGVQKAQEVGLPQPIIDFIQTHHGTSCPMVFYKKYMEKYPDADPILTKLKFSYPGPKPQNKEQAILMIADSIEASWRSIKDATPEDTAALVEKIINQKIADNQLLDCKLTFKDINIIKATAVQKLEHKTHKRVVYDSDPMSKTALENMVGLTNKQLKAKRKNR